MDSIRLFAAGGCLLNLLRLGSTVWNQPVASGLDYEYLGCYNDGYYDEDRADRVLSGPETRVTQDLTIDVCAEICASLGGYNFFGTEYGLQCFCGISTDEYNRFGRNDSCDYTCNGNRTETCGGYNTIDVYNFTELPDPPEMSYRSTGCFADSTEDRVMTGFKLTSENLTNEMCAKICIWSEEYAYFGTENGDECYCAIRSESFSRLGEDLCNEECDGDFSQICGGSSAVSAFEYIAPLPTPTPGLDYEYLGCYNDGYYDEDRADRVLSGPEIRVTQGLTTDVCAEICASLGGYNFFGTEYGLQCFCGFSADGYNRLGRNDSCDYSCDGNTTETCGGYSTIDVYNFTELPVSPEISYPYIGCFADSEDGRVLTGLNLTSEGLTNEMCANICAWSGEYPYFGTEDSDECYCGMPSDTYSRLGTGLCDGECAGNASQTCGGVSSFSAFQYLTPLRTPTPTQGQPTSDEYSGAPTRAPINDPSPSPSNVFLQPSGEPTGSEFSGPPTRSPIDNPSSPSEAQFGPSSGEPTGSESSGPPTRSPIDNPSSAPNAEGGEGSTGSDNESSFLWEIIITIVAGLALTVVTWLLKKLTRFNCAEAVSVWTARANVSRSRQGTRRAPP